MPVESLEKKPRASFRGGRYAQLRILAAWQKCETGNQADVARELGVSRQRVQEVLAEATRLNLI